MAAQVKSVKLTLNVRTTNNEDKSVNVGYVNPVASDTVLKQFAQQLNALTTNTLISTEKTVVTDITAA